MTLCSGDLELRKRSVFLLKNSATQNAYGMYNIVSLHLTIAFVHDIFVYICISLGVVDALNAATTSSLAFIHQRGLRVVSFQQKALRRPQVVELTTKKFHAFFMSSPKEILVSRRAVCQLHWYALRVTYGREKKALSLSSTLVLLVKNIRLYYVLYTIPSQYQWFSCNKF